MFLGARTARVGQGGGEDWAVAQGGYAVRLQALQARNRASQRRSQARAASRATLRGRSATEASDLSREDQGLVAGQRQAAGVHRGERGHVLRCAPHAGLPGDSGGVGNGRRAQSALRQPLQGRPASVPPVPPGRDRRVPVGPGVSAARGRSLPRADRAGHFAGPGDSRVGPCFRPAPRCRRAPARRQGGRNRQPGGDPGSSSDPRASRLWLEKQGKAIVHRDDAAVREDRSDMVRREVDRLEMVAGWRV